MKTAISVACLWLFLLSAVASGQPLAGIKIGIDPGHGGPIDTGAVGPTGLAEKTVTLSTALRLQAYLEADGATVFMTRTTDLTMTLSLADRTSYLMSKGVNLIVSIHQNGVNNPSVDDTMDFVYCGQCNTTAGTFASDVIQRVGVATGLPLGPPAAGTGENCSLPVDWSCGRSGVGKANLGMVRMPSQAGFPAFLVEVSFITDPAEEAKLYNYTYTDNNAWAIYAGIEDYYGFIPRSRIAVQATLDGKQWPGPNSSGPLSWQLTGASNITNGGVPATMSGATLGDYTLHYVSGGPTGVSPDTISPSPNQTLVWGGNITFTMNFSSGGVCRPGSNVIGVTCTPPPPACYALMLTRNDASGGGPPTAWPANSSGCGVGKYIAGANVQLTAYPASSFAVGGWIGTANDASTSTTNSLVMPASDKTVTVNYVPISQNGQPIVTTGGFDQITATSANLHMSVNPNGLGTNVYFAYGTDVVNSPNYTGQQYIGMGTTTVPFSAVAANLACGATYSYYAVGSNSAGRGTGQTQAFMTTSCPMSSAPTITSEWTDGITQASAVLYALVNPNGLQTTGNFQYGTNPASPNTTTPQPMGSATSPVELGWAINGLSCGTTYSYNVVASNSAGPSAGTWQTFRTSDCSGTWPSVANESVDSITQTSATLHAVVTPNGTNLAYAYFYYGLTSSYTNATPLQAVGTGWNALAFSQSVGGLACGTRYHFQVVGQNSFGPTRGADQTFWTVNCGGQPWNNGTVVVQATLDGAPWTGNVAYSMDGVSGGALFGGTVPASFPVSIEPPGVFGLLDIFGGPPNATLVAITPGYQVLAAGATLTFTLQFSSGPSSQMGTLIVNATLDGNPWTGPLTYTIFGPHSFNGSGENTIANVPAGGYAIIPVSGGPAGATLEIISPSGSGMTLLPGGILTITFVYQTSQYIGFLNAQATLDGSPWSGNVTYQVSGPTGSFTYLIAPQQFAEIPGTYNVQYVSGGPDSASFVGVSPSQSQTVNASRMSTFSLDFVSSTGFSGTSFYTLTPCRILDTRPPVNTPISASSGTAITIVGGPCGVPQTAQAVALNVTAVGPTSQGILSVYPVGSVPPNYTVAFGAGQIRAASTVIGLSPFGTVMIAFFTTSGQGQTNFLIDVTGYFQ